MIQCTFCSNTAIPAYSINYSKTGLVHHCSDCAMGFNLPQTFPQPVDN